MNIQTLETDAARTDLQLAPPNNFFVSRVQREFGRSNVGAIFVNKEGTGSSAGLEQLQPRLRRRHRAAD